MPIDKRHHAALLNICAREAEACDSCGYQIDIVMGSKEGNADALIVISSRNGTRRATYSGVTSSSAYIKYFDRFERNPEHLEQVLQGIVNDTELPFWMSKMMKTYAHGPIVETPVISIDRRVGMKETISPSARDSAIQEYCTRYSIPLEGIR